MTPNVTLNQNAILNLLCDELETSKQDLIQAFIEVAQKRRQHMRSAQASALSDKDLGEAITQDCFSDNATEDVMLAGYNEGYLQAVEDIHTLIHAYYKGLQ